MSKLSLTRTEPPSRRRLAPSLGWLKNAIGALALAGFAVYLWEHREHFSEALDVRPVDLSVLAALTLGSWAAVAAQNRLLYRAMGVEFGFGESLLITSASGFGNYLPLRPGTLLRAHYLKRVRGLRYTHFGSIFVVRTVFFTATTGATGLLCLAWIARASGRFSIELAAAFLALTVAPFAALFWIPRLATWSPHRLRHLGHEFRMGIEQLRSASRSSALVVLLVLVQFLLLGIRFRIAARAVDSELAIVTFVLLAAVGTLTGFVAITPGSLGIREAVMGYVTFAVGETFTRGVYVGVLDRAVSLALTATIGAVSFVVVWRRLRRLDALARLGDETPSAEIPFSAPG